MRYSTIVSMVLISMLGASSAASDPAFVAGSEQIHLDIDSFFALSVAELREPRQRSNVVDVPLSPGMPSTFSSSIAMEIAAATSPRKADLDDWYLNTFSVPLATSDSDISLMSMPMCEHSHADMAALLRPGRSVTDAELELINRFADHHNKGRAEFQGNGLSIKAAGHWSALMGCLAYTESLGDPDTPTSIRRSRELLGQDYAKPTGVKFYYDHRHRIPSSRWNVGLFQFVLVSGGNISPCLSGWNASNRTARKVPRGSISRVGEFMASPAQSLNAYCGVHKLLETMFVQKYTTDRRRTHPSNFDVGGGLKLPENRCATIHASYSYMHFGPFIRTDGRHRGGFTSNLDKLLQCTVAALPD